MLVQLCTWFLVAALRPFGLVLVHVSILFMLVCAPIMGFIQTSRATLLSNDSTTDKQLAGMCGGLIAQTEELLLMQRLPTPPASLSVFRRLS